MSPSRRIVQPIRPLSRGFFLHAMSRFASPGDDKLIMELMEDDLESLRRTLLMKSGRSPGIHRPGFFYERAKDLRSLLLFALPDGRKVLL